MDAAANLLNQNQTNEEQEEVGNDRTAASRMSVGGNFNHFSATSRIQE